MTASDLIFMLYRKLNKPVRLHILTNLIALDKVLDNFDNKFEDDLPVYVPEDDWEVESSGLRVMPKETNEPLKQFDLPKRFFIKT